MQDIKTTVQSMCDSALTPRSCCCFLLRYTAATAAAAAVAGQKQGCHRNQNMIVITSCLRIKVAVASCMSCLAWQPHSRTRACTDCSGG
jgi:hypothetical protein